MAGIAAHRSADLPQRPSSTSMRLATDQKLAVVPYSSEVQQPMRATAVLDRRPHMRWAAPGDREKGRAGSLHPDGLAAPGHHGQCLLAGPKIPAALLDLVEVLLDLWAFIYRQERRVLV